jgi:hypothetical protein
MANERESCVMEAGEREPSLAWYIGVCQPWEYYNNKRLLDIVYPAAIRLSEAIASEALVLGDSC